MNVDHFLDKEYDPTTYNCGHFVTEVYKELTGEDIGPICHAFLDRQSPRFFTMLRNRQKLDEPETPCIAVMKIDGFPTHAGVYIDGRILHLSDNGPVFHTLETVRLRYPKGISFYR